MRVLRRTWPLASILFVTLAGAEIASADDTSTTSTTSTARTAASEARPVSLRLLGRTWCLGEPPGVTCDVRLPLATPDARSAAVAPAANQAITDRPFHRFLRRMKQLFEGVPRATTSG